jgi:hypothetical protein
MTWKADGELRAVGYDVRFARLDVADETSIALASGHIE